MSANPLLFMPFLHKEFRPAALPPALLHLWPGLPEPRKGFHVPPDYPLTPQEAAHFLEQMRGIAIDAADNMPAHCLLAAEKHGQHPEILKETRDIAAFAQDGEVEADANLDMREAEIAAQKFLLCVWLLEERHLEIRELERRCRSLSGDLRAALGVEVEDEEKDALLLVESTQRLDDSAGPTVPWRLFLENAALFLPEHGTLLVTDASICAELRDLALPLAKVQAKLYFPGQHAPEYVPELLEACLWEAFGLPGARPERPWLAKRFSFLLWDDAR